MNAQECVNSIVSAVHNNQKQAKKAFDDSFPGLTIANLKNHVYLHDFLFSNPRFSQFEQYYVPDVLGDVIIGRNQQDVSIFSKDPQGSRTSNPKFQTDIIVPTKKVLNQKQLMARKCLEEGIKCFKVKQLVNASEYFEKASGFAQYYDVQMNTIIKFYLAQLKYYHEFDFDQSTKNYPDIVKETTNDLLFDAKYLVENQLNLFQQGLVQIQATQLLSFMYLLYRALQALLAFPNEQRKTFELTHYFYHCHQSLLQVCSYMTPSFFGCPQLLQMVCNFSPLLKRQTQQLILFSIKTMVQKYVFGNKIKWLNTQNQQQDQQLLQWFVCELLINEYTPSSFIIGILGKVTSGQYLQLQTDRLLNLFENQIFSKQGFYLHQFIYQIPESKQNNKQKGFKIQPQLFMPYKPISQQSKAFFFKSEQQVVFQDFANKISITQNICSVFEKISMNLSFTMQNGFSLQTVNENGSIQKQKVDIKGIDKIPKIFADKSFKIQLFLNPLDSLKNLYSSLKLESIVLSDISVSCDVLTQYYEQQSSSLIIEAIIHNYNVNLNAILFKVHHLVVNLAGVLLKIIVEQQVLQLNRYANFFIKNIRTFGVQEVMQSFGLDQIENSKELNTWKQGASDRDTTVLMFQIDCDYINQLASFNLNTDPDFILLTDSFDVISLSSSVSTKQALILIKIRDSPNATNAIKQDVKINFEKVILTLTFNNYNDYIRNRHLLPMYHINHGYLVMFDNKQKLQAAFNTNGEIINIIPPHVSQQLVFAENKFQVELNDSFNMFLPKQQLEDELACISEQNFVIEKKIEDEDNIIYISFDEKLKTIIRDHQMSIQVVELNCLMTSNIIFQQTEEFRVISFGDCSLQFVLYSSGVSLKKQIDLHFTI